MKQLGTTAMHIFLFFSNLETIVLYSQASGLCLIVRNTGKQLRENIIAEKISGPGDLMLNIPLLTLILLKGAHNNIYLGIWVFWINLIPPNSHAHFFSRPNLKTTVLYSQASGLCLIVRNTGSRWLDIFTCKNPRPTHHIYWPVLSLFFIMYKLESYENAQNLQNGKSNWMKMKVSDLREFI